jgi:glycosyltransferase involved in cell wall biosynthesis
MNLLWITPRWPEPANDGAKIATLQLLKNLQSDSALHITLAALISENESTSPISSFDRIDVRILKRILPAASPALRFLSNPRLPVTFSSFATEELTEALLKIVNEKKWDGIVMDGLHAAIPFLKMNLAGPSFQMPGKTKIFYRAHNVEFSLWEQAATATPAPQLPKKIALTLQSKLVKAFEKSLGDASEKIFPVSEEDAKIFGKLCPQVKAPVIRIGQDFPKNSTRPKLFPHEHAPPIELGFIGRIDWLPNREGLEWFLNSVWPELNQNQVKKFRLRIAGSGDGTWLQKYNTLPDVQFLGKIDAVDSFYESIQASIVPLFMGSGTRVKVIESSRYAVPVISTALGVEGCPLINQKSYLQAETQENWISVLNGVTPETLFSLGDRAFYEMKVAYDSASIATQMASHMKSS